MASLTDSIRCTSPVVVDKFRVAVRPQGGSTITPPGEIDVTPDASGLVGEVTIDTFLTGQSTGAYDALCKSVDSNGQESSVTVQGFNYNPPPAPTVDIVT